MPKKKTEVTKNAIVAEKLIVQSVLGGEITCAEIIEKVTEAAGDVDAVYIKPEENRAYYVKDGVPGSVILWD